MGARIFISALGHEPCPGMGPWDEPRQARQGSEGFTSSAANLELSIFYFLTTSVVHDLWLKGWQRVCPGGQQGSQSI